MAAAHPPRLPPWMAASFWLSPGSWLGISHVSLPLAERVPGSSHAPSLNVMTGDTGLRKLGSRTCALFSPLSKLTAFQPVPVHIRQPKPASATVQRALTSPPRSLCTESAPSKRLRVPCASGCCLCPSRPGACATTC